MSDFRRDGKQVWGPNGEHGYDQGNRINYDGKTYYKEPGGYFCAETGQTYHVDGNSAFSPDDGMYGVIDDFGFTVIESGREKKSAFELFASNNDSFNSGFAENLGSFIALCALFAIYKICKFVWNTFKWTGLLITCLACPLMIIPFAFYVKMYSALIKRDKSCGKYVHKICTWIWEHLKWFGIIISCCILPQMIPPFVAYYPFDEKLK